MSEQTRNPTSNEKTLIARLVELAEAERDVAYSVDMPPEKTANWGYALTALQARDEINRLRASIEHLGLYVAVNGDDWVQKTAHEYLNGAPAPTLSSMRLSAPETTGKPVSARTLQLFVAIDDILGSACPSSIEANSVLVRRDLIGRLAAVRHSPEEISTDGWKCASCGHENPKGVLRCQNPKCTVLAYQPEKAPATYSCGGWDGVSYCTRGPCHTGDCDFSHKSTTGE